MGRWINTESAEYLLEARHFEPWGNITRHTNLFTNTLDDFFSSDEPIALLDRGYTGHEHLWRAGLVNMNVRLYESKLHRFMQALPFTRVRLPWKVWFLLSKKARIREKTMLCFMLLK